MRQAAREIMAEAALEAVIRQADVCRLAIFDGEYPYIVPMNFGYADRSLYFHCAREGKKLDLIAQNNRVGFELEAVAQIVAHPELPCKWTTKYQSVIGRGRAHIVQDEGERKTALDLIMQQYTHQKRSWDYPQEHFKLTAILRVEIERMTGKQSKEFLKPKE